MTLKRTRRAMKVFVVSAAGLALLTGCGDKGGDVASLGNQAKNASGDSQLKAAQGMVACMQKADVEVELWEEGKPEEASFGINGQKPYQMCWDDGCEMSMGEAGQNATDAQWEAFDKQMEEMIEPYRDDTGNTKSVLIYDGKDLTKQFRACLKDTGYKRPEYKADPAEELKQKQATAKAGAEWAQCARQNGLPNIKDPVAPKADNWESSPDVIIPGKVTVEQVNNLLAKCPTFDAEAQKACDKAISEMKEGDFSMPDVCPDRPSVILDDAAWGIDPNNSDASSNPAMNQMDAVWSALYKAEQDYYESQGGPN